MVCINISLHLGANMAITKTGQKLVKRTFYAELEDWEKLAKIAKRENKSVGQYIRVFTNYIIKKDDERQKQLDEKKATD